MFTHTHTHTYSVSVFCHLFVHKTKRNNLEISGVLQIFTHFILHFSYYLHLIILHINSSSILKKVNSHRLAGSPEQIMDWLGMLVSDWWVVFYIDCSEKRSWVRRLDFEVFVCHSFEKKIVNSDKL